MNVSSKVLEEESKSCGSGVSHVVNGDGGVGGRYIDEILVGGWNTVGEIFQDLNEAIKQFLRRRCDGKSAILLKHCIVSL